MKLLKNAILGSALALTFSAAHATPASVLGVTWDTDAATDFTSQSINLRQFIDTATGVLSGFGIITAFNGTDQATFCPSCELTFQFGGYNPIGGTIIPGVGETISYTGGWVNVYVGEIEITNPADYLSLNFANTGNGDLFLSLAGNGTFLGTNLGNTILSGLGYLDVTGGAAADYFDTNTQANGSDILFSASLTFKHRPGAPVSIADMSGTGNMFGDTVAYVPEPGALALVGLGLLGMGATRRRNTK